MLKKKFFYALLIIAIFNSLTLGVNASPRQEVSICGAGNNAQIYLPIVVRNLNVMGMQGSGAIAEQLQKRLADFPYDAIITEVFTDSVNVRPVGSPRIVHAQLADHIDVSKLRIGYPVKLDRSSGTPFVIAFFDQWSDEDTEYAGQGNEIPGKPAITVIAQQDGWHISWATVSGADHYTVFWNDTNDGDTPEELMTTTQTSVVVGYDDDDVAPKIYFAVRAISGLLEGETSLWVTDSTSPSTPGLTASGALDSHVLAVPTSDPVWNDASLKCIEIEVADDDLGTNATPLGEYYNTSDFPVQEYFTSGVVTKYYRARAVDWADNASEWTDWQGATSLILSAPTNLDLYPGPDGWELSWGILSGASNYNVYRADDDLGTNATLVTSTTRTDATIPYGSNVYFAVRGVSLNEGNLSAWTSETTSPALPSTFVADSAIAGHSLEISGSDPCFADRGFDYIEIEIADDNLGTNATVFGNFYSFVDFPYLNPFGPDTLKYYRARAVDHAGYASDWTSWDSAYSGVDTIKDLFDGYGGSEVSDVESLYWLRVANVEQNENWNLSSNATWVSATFEGNRAIQLTTSLPGLYTEAILTRSMDLSQDGRFGDDDWVIIQLETPGYDLSDTDIEIWFWNTNGTPDWSGYRIVVNPTGSYPEFNVPLKLTKSQFSAVGSSPDWSTINGFGIRLHNYDGFTTTITIDDIRIVKAIPTDTDRYDDTGDSWLHAAPGSADSLGEWHIYEGGGRNGEPYPPYGYGQVRYNQDWDLSPITYQLSYKSLNTTDIKSGTIQAGVFVHSSTPNESAGVAFFIKDVSPQNWSMYTIELDTNTLSLAKWVSGTRTVIDSTTLSFNANNQVVFLGADFSSYDADGGRIKVYASLSETGIIQASNLKLSVQDNQWVGDTGGSVGLISAGGNVRFVNFTAGSDAHAETADWSRKAALADSATEADHAADADTLNGDGEGGGVTAYDVSNVPTDTVGGTTTGTELDADQIHTAGLGAGQIWIAGSNIDANATIRLGNGLAGGQSAQNVQLANGTSINEFSIDGTLSGNSDVAVPTEKAVKTYVDNASAGGVVQFVRSSNLAIAAASWTWIDYDSIGQSAGTAPVSRTSSGVYTAQFEGHFSIDLSYQFYHGYTGNATFYYLLYIYDSGDVNVGLKKGTVSGQYSANTKWGHVAFSLYMNSGWYVRPRLYLNQATAGNIQPSIYTQMNFGGIPC